jgi:hypothetical protein
MNELSMEVVVAGIYESHVRPGIRAHRVANRRWTRRTARIAGLVALGLGALVFSPSAAWASPTISNVQFTGNTTASTITISGSGFGTSPPSGVSDDSNYCGAYTNNGEDYGTNLYIVTSNAGGPFQAGYGDPSSGACVGLIVDEWTPTQVVLSFGNAYNTAFNWYLQAGYGYTMNVDGSSLAGTVAFDGSSNTAPCAANTTCTAVDGSTKEDVVASGTSSTAGSITLSQAASILNCGAKFDYTAPINTLSESTFTSSSSLTVVDVLGEMPSTHGVKICFQPLGATPPPPSFLKKCTHKVGAPCFDSLVEVAGSVVATMQLPPNDPRFWAAGALPVAKKLVPSSGAVGATVSVKGSNFSEVVSVLVGSTPATITSTSASKIKFVVPSGAVSGYVTVVSAAGQSVTTQMLTVTG